MKGQHVKKNLLPIHNLTSHCYVTMATNVKSPASFSRSEAAKASRGTTGVLPRILQPGYTS